MTKKSVPPSIKETAFDCPHRGAYTTQHWFEMHAEQVDREDRIPFIPDEEDRKRVLSAKDIPAGKKKKGTGHHLGATSLMCLMGDFNSWRVVQPVGMA